MEAPFRLAALPPNQHRNLRRGTGATDNVNNDSRGCLVLPDDDKADDSGPVKMVDIDAVVAGLGTRFNPDEAAIAERLLREYGGTIPDGQLVEEVGLAIATLTSPR